MEHVVRISQPRVNLLRGLKSISQHSLDVWNVMNTQLIPRLVSRTALVASVWIHTRLI